MAVATITDDAINNLRLREFFDPDAAFNYGTATELSLVSRDGYELVLQGSNFDFDNDDAPTSGTITDVFLYDPSGDLVGRIDDVSTSLEDYYDTVAVGNRPNVFTADLLSGADTLNGGSRADYLEGYGGNDLIRGAGGDDLLVGGDGADTLDGGLDDDDLDGGAGNDRIDGGDGEDLAFAGTGNDTVSGGADEDSLAGEAGNDVLSGGSGDDELEGDAGRDRVNGDGGNDILGGGADNDRVSGGVGDDELYGDGGNDLLNGGSGADSIDGGSGADTLIGGSGRDVFFGGAGDDQFRFESDTDTAGLVQDFTRGDDLLVFDASGFDNLTANFDLVVGDDATATTTNGTFLFDTDGNSLFYDSNGTGAGGSTLIATLDDLSTLSKSDFLIA